MTTQDLPERPNTVEDEIRAWVISLATWGFSTLVFYGLFRILRGPSGVALDAAGVFWWVIGVNLGRSIYVLRVNLLANARARRAAQTARGQGDGCD